MLVMETTFITLAVLGLCGLVIWFVNRRSVSQLNEEIQDKNAIITALKTHVETEIVEPTKSAAKRKSVRKNDTSGKKPRAATKTNTTKKTTKKRTTK